MKELTTERLATNFTNYTNAHENHRRTQIRRQISISDLDLRLQTSDFDFRLQV